MRDRFTYETIIPRIGNTKAYNLAEALPFMSLRFVTFVTPGRWSFRCNSISIDLGENPHIDLVGLDDPFLECASNSPVCGHPLNGFTNERIQDFICVYEGEGDDCEDDGGYADVEPMLWNVGAPLLCTGSQGCMLRGRCFFLFPICKRCWSLL